MSVYQRTAFLFVTTLVLGLSPIPAQAQSSASSTDKPELKVGDRWKTERRDPRTKVVQSTGELTVTTVAPTKIDASGSGGDVVMTPDLTVLSNPRLNYDTGYQFLSFPIQVGKKWEFKTAWQNKVSGSKGSTQMDVEVKSQERIKVAAGEFDAYRLEANGYMNLAGGNNRRVNVIYWYAPQAKAIVRMEWNDRFDDYVSELIEFTPAP